MVDGAEIIHPLFPTRLNLAVGELAREACDFPSSEPAQRKVVCIACPGLGGAPFDDFCRIF